MATRERSPNYPALGLPDAIELVQKLYSAEKRASAPYESAASALGYNSLSGRVRVKISVLRKYGLVDEAKGRVRVSDLAMRILFERSPQDKQAAIEDAAMRPELFRELRKNAEASDTTLVNDLVRQGFSMGGARAAVASFRGTMDVVAASPIGYDEPESEDEPMMEQQLPPYQPAPKDGLPRPPRDRFERDPRSADYSWPLPKGVRVELRFAGGPFTKDGLRVLRKYLDVLEEAIPEAEEQVPSSPRREIANDSEPPS